MKSVLSKIWKNSIVILMTLTALGEIMTGSWFSGIGWGAAAFYLFAYKTEREYFNELLALARKNVHNNEIERKAAIIDTSNTDIDHILAIGRDLQNSDKWHGAQYDTVKLLCDTIESLREKERE